MFRTLATIGLVAAAAAIFALTVRPAQVESASHAAVVEKPLLNMPGAVPRTQLTWQEERRLEAALATFRASPAAAPPPVGIEERKPGVFGGRIPWSDVQGFLAWASARREAVETVEVQAIPEDKERAECRLVVAPGDSR
jgi:hypothetical protein